MTNEEAYLEALKAELGYVKAQPKVRQDRVADIEAEIKRREPAEPEPEVEVAAVEAPEKAVHPKPKPRKS